MTYEEASRIYTVHQLTGQEQAAYEQILHLLDEVSTEEPLNLFPIVLHFVSDAIASQIGQEPVHTREGRIVTVTEDVLVIVRMLALAKCVLAEDIEENNP